MEKNEIEEYLDNILMPNLIELKVSNSYAKEIRQHIETQLETIASNDCKKAGIDKGISDEQLIHITSSAIRYFNSINLRKVAQKIDYSQKEDIYLKVTTKYPVVWNALMQLCMCTGKEKSYEKIKDYKKISIKDLQPREEAKKYLSIDNKYHIDYQSGITLAFSNELIDIVTHILSDFKQQYFYTDCFKHITRNIEKLFMIIEILLQNNKVFLTSNYYISNNYVAKRTKILKASHKVEEIQYKLTQLNGLSQKHSELLKSSLQPYELIV